MNKKEYYNKIKEIIKAGDEDMAARFMYEDIGEEENPEFEGMKIVDSYGGEGQGENYYTVWYFPKGDIYIKFDGYYQSYNGSEYEDMYQVEPQEVMVTQYNAV